MTTGAPGAKPHPDRLTTVPGPPACGSNARVGLAAGVLVGAGAAVAGIAVAGWAVAVAGIAVAGAVVGAPAPGDWPHAASAIVSRAALRPRCI
jgi:hypothetical protein